MKRNILERHERFSFVNSKLEVTSWGKINKRVPLI
jgi:hypothetical protein